MTVAEAKVAVRFNSIVEETFHKIRGYAYSIKWINEKDKKPYTVLGVRDLKANSIIEARPEAFAVVDWKAQTPIIDYFIEQEKEGKRYKKAGKKRPLEVLYYILLCQRRGTKKESKQNEGTKQPCGSGSLRKKSESCRVRSGLRGSPGEILRFAQG